MNNKLKKDASIILFAILIFIIVFAIPLFTYRFDLKKLSLSLELLQGISTFVTLIIAVLVLGYINKAEKLVDKQFHTITELLDTLSHQKIFLSINPPVIEGIDAEAWSIVLSNPEKILKKKTYWAKIKDLPVFFSLGYFTISEEIEKFFHNPFLPKQIALKLEKLIIFSMIPLTPEQKEHSHIKMSHPSNTTAKSSKDYTIMNITNDKDLITLESFLNPWMDITNEIKKWLKEERNTYTDLNF